MGSQVLSAGGNLTRALRDPHMLARHGSWDRIQCHLSPVRSTGDQHFDRGHKLCPVPRLKSGSPTELMPDPKLDMHIVAAGWHISHNAIKVDMNTLKEAIAALEKTVAAGEALAAWQVRRTTCSSVLRPIAKRVGHALSMQYHGE